MDKYSNIEAINYIYQYSRYYGNVLYECEELYKEKRGIILINTFFNMVENIIKSVNEEYNDNFFNNINKLNKVVSNQEISFLHEIRGYRNDYAHDDLNLHFLEIDGIAYNYAEDDTAILLYKILSNKTYNILVKIIKNKISD